MSNGQMLFEAIRAAMVGKTITPPETEAEMAALYKLAKHHDVAHLLAAALQGQLLQEDMTAALHRQYMTAIFRTEQLLAAQAELTEALEAAEIPFIPLKGAILRELYPERFMRTSCDIDVLVHEQDLPRATAYLCEHVGYEKTAQGPYDVSFTAVGGVHVELHFDLSATYASAEAAAVLQDIWAYASPVGESCFHYALRDDAFYFYHIAHMAKHFVHGGCGVRSFLDLTLLDRGVDGEVLAARNALLQQGGLLHFATTVRALAAYWFAEGEKPPHHDEAEAFILSGGSYGTHTNKLQNSQARHGGRVRFVLSRIFLRYDAIKYIYPILQKHKWLTPFYEIRRLFALIFSKSARRHLRRTMRASNDEISARAVFLQNVGLQ